MTANSPPDQAHIQIIMDVVLDANGEDHDYLAQRMNSAIFGAISANGMLTLDSDALVHKQSFRTNLMTQAAADVTENQITQFLAARIQSGALPMDEIPSLLARFALADPSEIREEIAGMVASSQVHAPMFQYALADSIEHGLQGGFNSGPYPAFNPNWMSGDDIIMRLYGDGGVEIAYDEMTQHAGAMSSELFEMLRLYDKANEGLHGTVRLKKLLDASPFASADSTQAKYPQRSRP